MRLRAERTELAPGLRARPRAYERERRGPPCRVAGERVARRASAPSTRATYLHAYRHFAGFLAARLGRIPSRRNSPRQPCSTSATASRPSEGPGRRSPRTSRRRRLAAALESEGVDPAAQRVRANAVGRRAPRPLTRAELERLLAMPERRTRRGRRDLAIVLLLGQARAAASGGLRPSLRRPRRAPARATPTSPRPCAPMRRRCARRSCPSSAISASPRSRAQAAAPGTRRAPRARRFVTLGALSLPRDLSQSGIVYRGWGMSSFVIARSPLVVRSWSAVVLRSPAEYAGDRGCQRDSVGVSIGA